MNQTLRGTNRFSPLEFSEQRNFPEWHLHKHPSMWQLTSSTINLLHSRTRLPSFLLKTGGWFKLLISTPRLSCQIFCSFPCKVFASTILASILEMENRSQKSAPARKQSSGSGFFDVPLSNELVIPIGDRTSSENATSSPKAPVLKKPSLKKKNSWNPDFDGVLHMGYVWYFEQNAEKKTPEELLYRGKEDKLSRILTLDRETTKSGWRKYFVAIWSDGRFAWYKPAKFSLYNKKLTGELEEVLFVPWRVCAFGEEVVRKLCPKHPRPSPYPIRPDDVEAQLEGMTMSPPQTPKLPLLSGSPPTNSLLTSFLETAGKGLCICTSPSVISLIVPQSPSSATSSSEELVCIVPKTSSQSLLMAVGGHDWLRGDVYCFACDTQDDLDIWRDCFALLTHRKIVQQSAFDHLLNTPVMVTLPTGPSF